MSANIVGLPPVRKNGSHIVDLDAEAVVKKTLGDSLFTDARFAIMGTAITAGVAAICWVRSDSTPPLAIAFATCAVFIFRIVIARRRKAKWFRWHDTAFAAAGIFYLTLIGILTFWALSYSDDPFMITISLIISISNTLSIPLRFFTLERYVKLQLLGISTPILAAFVYRGGYFWVATLAQIVVIWFGFSSARRMRAMLMSEMNYRRKSEIVASQFKFAIDNMSHGLCMIAPDMRLVVSNAKLAECLSLPANHSLDGVHFGALVRMARRRGTLDHDSAGRLLATFNQELPPDHIVRSEAPGANGRTLDVTFRRHEEGGWILVVQDVTDQKRAQEALNLAARFDPVTGLPNRRSFEHTLGQRLLEARGSFARTDVVFLDLDGFKQINDTLGHKFGDRVLTEAAARLRAVIGQKEYVSRWGGDEFVILRRAEDEKETIDFTEMAIRELSRPLWIEGTEVVVGASAGVACCIGGVANMDILLQQADMALYSAKRENRGSCRVYEVSMSDKARDRRLMELDLQAALAARSFELHYQPIVNIETGELVSFEALARWRHPVRGSVSPGIFVPVLEDLNLMNAFGAWALQRACEDAARWPAPIRVGVNASSRQLDTLAESVRRALANSGLAPERLEIEITETAALAAGDSVRKTLESLHALGVKIALDDFGTGYSSLSHLMQLPLDKVKIDRSFTQQLGKSRKADVLVANIARLSSQLGMRVTFEGIETNDQLERALALGVVAEGQGWLFGKPAPVEDLAAMFATAPESRVA